MSHYDRQTPVAQPDYISLKWTQNIIDGVNWAGLVGRTAGALNLGIQGVGKTVQYSSSVVIGAAWNFVGDEGPSKNNIYSFSAANETTLGELWLESDFTLSLYGGGHQNLIANSGSGSPPLTLKGNVYYYIEVKCTVFDNDPLPMTITMDLHVNGVEVCNGTGSVGQTAADTLLGIAKGNYHTFRAGAVSGATYLCDLYIADLTAGGILSNFAGDISIATVFPRADVTMNWTPVGGASGTACVNPQYPETNDDTIYIKDNNPGDVANFDWQPIPAFTGTIIGVHYGIFNKKDGESTRSIQQTTEGTPNGPILYPSDQYRYDFFGMDADPGTGAAWTQSGFNSATFGVIVNS
jgi:hypothetical protein